MFGSKIKLLFVSMVLIFTVMFGSCAGESQAAVLERMLKSSDVIAIAEFIKADTDTEKEQQFTQDGEKYNYELNHTTAYIKLLETFRGDAKPGDIIQVKYFDFEGKEIEEKVGDKEEYVLFLKGDSGNVYIDLMPAAEHVQLVDGKTKVNPSCHLFKDGIPKDEFFKDINKIIDQAAVYDTDQIGKENIIYADITIDNASKSEEDICSIIFNDYLKPYRSSNASESSRLKEYKINNVSIQKSDNSLLEFTVEYSVLPMYPNKYVTDESTKDGEEGWKTNIIRKFSVNKNNDIYTIVNITQ